MARWRRGEELTVKRRQRGTGGSGDHGDADLGVLVVSEVRDCVQLEVAEALAKRRRRKLPAAVSGGGWRSVL
jgi:hypothetical protein